MSDEIDSIIQELKADEIAPTFLTKKKEPETEKLTDDNVGNMYIKSLRNW